MWSGSGVADRVDAMKDAPAPWIESKGRRQPRSVGIVGTRVSRADMRLDTAGLKVCASGAGGGGDQRPAPSDADTCEILSRNTKT